MITGTFYRTEGVGFPAIFIKDLDDEHVLICAFTDGGPMTDAARSATDGTAGGTFVRDV
jgi:hypothetical protein